MALLDTYTGAKFAYSFRKLRTAYAGSAIRLRRVDNGGEADIGFSGSNFDSAAAATHISGTTGVISTWYDQSGNALDLVEPTSRPVYSASGLLSKPTVSFTAASAQILQTVGAPLNLGVGTLSCFCMATLNSAAVSYGRLVSIYEAATADYDGTTRAAVILRDGGSQAITAFRASAVLNSANVTYGTPFIAASIFNGSLHKTYVNGANSSSVVSTGTFGTALSIALSLGLGFYDGLISEVVAWPTDQTANQTAIHAEISSFYNAASTGDLKLYAPLLDSGLADLANANKLYICSQVPTTYAEATTGGAYALGNADVTPGAPAASGSGRQVTVPAITAGSVTNTGTPTYWALVRTGTGALMATGQLTGVALTSGQTFTLQALTIIQAGVSV